MGGKIQSLLLSISSALIAVFLLFAAAYEFSRGETAMSVFVSLAMVCAIAMCWYTRKPYHPRIRFKPEHRKYRYPGDRRLKNRIRD